MRDSTSIEVRWLPPKSSAQINSYKVSAEEIHNSNSVSASTLRVLNDKVSGSSFLHIFNHLSPLSTYNISVQAISDEWGKFLIFLIFFNKKLF